MLSKTEIRKNLQEGIVGIIMTVLIQLSLLHLLSIQLQLYTDATLPLYLPHYIYIPMQNMTFFMWHFSDEQLGYYPLCAPDRDFWAS